jgi:hypothetical protein
MIKITMNGFKELCHDRELGIYFEQYDTTPLGHHKEEISDDN